VILHSEWSAIRRLARNGLMGQDCLSTKHHDPCTTNSLFFCRDRARRGTFHGTRSEVQVHTLPQSLLRGADRPHFSCPSGRSASAVLRIEWRRAQGKNQSRKSERFTLHMLPRMHHEVVPAELLRIASKQGAQPEMRSDPYTSLAAPGCEGQSRERPTIEYLGLT
jgi:hypothetical protein